MRTALIIMFLSVLTACSTARVQPGLEAKEGVQINNPGQTMRYLTHVELLRRSVPSGPNTLPLCVAQNVPNENFTLKDSADSYVSVFTGRYYHKQNMREVGAGVGKKFVSDDGRALVTKGSTRYQYKFGLVTIDKAIVYTLSVEPAEDGMRYFFTDLKQAQLNTGSISNDGFNAVGAWPGAKPLKAYDQLASVADTVDQCIANRE